MISKLKNSKGNSTKKEKTPTGKSNPVI